MNLIELNRDVIYIYYIELNRVEIKSKRNKKSGEKKCKRSKVW